MIKRQILAFAACSALIVASTAGCQIGRMSASINSDSKVPTLGFHMLPKQTEPEIDSSAFDVGEYSE